jgi:hypothetical protein
VISRRAFVKQSAATVTGLFLAWGVARPRKVLAETLNVGVPAKVVNLTYDPEAGEITSCIELPVGLYKASQLGQAGFAVRLEVNYTSGGNPVNVSSTTALSDLSKVEIDKGTVEVEGCIEAPFPPDDINAMKGEAIIFIPVEVGE